LCGTLEYLINELYRVGALVTAGRGEGRGVDLRSEVILSKPDIYELVIRAWIAKLEGLNFDFILSMGLRDLAYASTLAWIRKCGVGYVVAEGGSVKPVGLLAGKKVLLLSESTRSAVGRVKEVILALGRANSVPVAYTVLMDNEEGDARISSWGIGFLPLLKASRVLRAASSD